MLLTVCATALAYFLWYKPKFSGRSDHLPFSLNVTTDAKTVIFSRLHENGETIKTFAGSKNYNEEICFMIDMGIESGRKRFFVYNLKKDSVELSGLVAHGQGSSTREIEFSNEPGSYCTSLGKYRIGGAYNGRFGLAYKLHGLDKTNSKALERFVVLHAHECVPNGEVAPIGICQSQGCPTVSPDFLQHLAKYISASPKPVLLMIYK
ncbi:murein L,D-transpeptidase catalytic domain-containing protein [Ferruginibacter sp. HRS2-29]|uniref:murein L,D-transpeptidase catalytic domain-containing protein n=1 Tax=Ferruginibacter sp. HRS2-29 TaxID=2487334 RepID=UPI0020CE9019|nr:murein L,D-transpeptidase catalytic domain family protein [Ferruginibacter sp. HRS2-29]